MLVQIQPSPQPGTTAGHWLVVVFYIGRCGIVPHGVGVVARRGGGNK
jgi:hypothetical protein